MKFFLLRINEFVDDWESVEFSVSSDSNQMVPQGHGLGGQGTGPVQELASVFEARDYCRPARSCNELKYNSQVTILKLFYLQQRTMGDNMRNKEILSKETA